MISDKLKKSILNYYLFPKDISNWTKVKLGEITDYSKNKSIPGKDISDNSWLLELEDIESNSGKLLQKVRKKDRKGLSNKNIFYTGNVLFGKLRPYLNKCIIADENGYCSTEIIPMNVDDKIDPRYLQKVLMSPNFMKYANTKSYGTKMPRLGTKDAISFEFYIPDLETQISILNKINYLFNELDDINNIEMKIRDLKKSFGSDFKLSVLSYAFKGQFNNQLQKRKKIVENDIIFNIPENWNICHFSDLNLLPTGVKKYVGLKEYYSTGSITDDNYISEGEFSYDDRPSRANRIAILNTIIEARMEKTQKALIIDDTLSDSLLSTGFFQIGESEKYIQKYIYYYLLSYEFCKQKNSLCTGATQKSINDGNLSKIAIPLPSIDEQKKICLELDKIIPLCDDIERIVNEV